MSNSGKSDERSRRRVCLGPLTRRDAIRAGALSALGLGFADVLRLRHWSALGGVIDGSSAPGASTAWKGVAGNPAMAGVELPADVIKGMGKAKHCILVWLAGGPSHIDTWDPKPDAPADTRGEFKPIATSVPGVSISEILPKMAALLNKVTLIRSMTSPEADHARAAHHLLTGYRPLPSIVYPSLGSVVAKVQSFDKQSDVLLPPYVAIPAAPAFVDSGYLTPAYDAFVVAGDPNAGNFRVRDLTPPDKLTLQRLRRRQRMVKQLDGFAHDHVGDTPLTVSRDKFSDKAYELLTSYKAQQAFQIDQEPAALRERYGRNPRGQAFLLARRLIESGVSFVTVNDQANALGWDTHVQNFSTLKDQLVPALDQGLSALLEDLGERGLLESTLVVMMGEFGRTPKINGQAGRDHHGRANSVILAGAGVPAGLVLGKTDNRADNPADRPVTPSDLAATVYAKLGIHPLLRFASPDGQQIKLIDNGRMITEIM